MTQTGHQYSNDVWPYTTSSRGLTRDAGAAAGAAGVTAVLMTRLRPAAAAAGAGSYWHLRDPFLARPRGGRATTNTRSSFRANRELRSCAARRARTKAECVRKTVGMRPEYGRGRRT